MCIRPWGDVNHDLRVCFGESGDERRAEEIAARRSVHRNVRRGFISLGTLRRGVNILHASRTTPFVAVVEVEAFALEDEGTYAILRWGVSTFTCLNSSDLTWAVDVVRRPVTGIL